MPKSDHSNVVVKVHLSLLCLVRHCPHHEQGPLLPRLCPHTFTVQWPPLDTAEITASVVRQNKIMSWWGIKPMTLLSEGIIAYAEPLLKGRRSLYSPTYPCRDGDSNP